MGLACVPEGCIPDACNPGEAMCTCLQPGDVCAQGWTCIEGLCRDAPITTDGMTSMPSQTDTTGEPPVTSTMSPDTTTDATIGTTMVEQTSAQETGVVECSEDTVCTDCAFCSTEVLCANEYSACMADMSDCMGPLMCIYACLSGNPSMWDDCVGACGCGNGNVALQELVGCIVGVCDAVCEMGLPCSKTD